MTVNITELVDKCRSKNAGPFLVTLDLVCKDEAAFRRIRDSGVWNAKTLADLYGVDADDVQIVEFELGLAFKATLPRLVGSGDPLDTDVYGAQQHAPLLGLQV